MSDAGVRKIKKIRDRRFFHKPLNEWTRSNQAWTQFKAGFTMETETTTTGTESNTNNNSTEDATNVSSSPKSSSATNEFAIAYNDADGLCLGSTCPSLLPPTGAYTTLSHLAQQLATAADFKNDSVDKAAAPVLVTLETTGSTTTIYPADEFRSGGGVVAVRRLPTPTTTTTPKA